MEKVEKFPYYIFDDLESNQYFDRLINQILALQVKIEELEKQILLLEKNGQNS